MGMQEIHSANIKVHMEELMLERPRVNVVEICKIPSEIKLQIPINISQPMVEPNRVVSGKLHPKSHAQWRKVLGSNWP